MKVEELIAQHKALIEVAVRLLKVNMEESGRVVPAELISDRCRLLQHGGLFVLTWPEINHGYYGDDMPSIEMQEEMFKIDDLHVGADELAAMERRVAEREARQKAAAADRERLITESVERAELARLRAKYGE